MKSPIRFLVSVGLALALLTALFVWGGVEPARVVDAFARLPLPVYFTALAVHVGIYLTRALRFQVLLPRGQRPPFRELASVSAAHNLAAYVLPAKTGELAFVVYLKKYAGVDAERALASLVVSRILDLALLSLGLGSASAGLALAGELPQWAIAVGALLCLGGIALLGLASRPGLILAPVRRVGRGLGLDRSRVGAGLLARVDSTSAALSATADVRRAPLLALSAAIWLGIFLFYAVLARGFGLAESVDLARAAVGSGFAVAANLLPINGVAGFGTQEGGWVLGFGWLGVPTELALSTGVSVHLVQLFNVCLFGLLGHLGMGWLGGRRVKNLEATPESTRGDSPR